MVNRARTPGKRGLTGGRLQESRVKFLKTAFLILGKELVRETQQTFAGYSETQKISLKTSCLLVMEKGDFRTDVSHAGAIRHGADDFQITFEVGPVEMPPQ